MFAPASCVRRTSVGARAVCAATQTPSLSVRGGVRFQKPSQSASPEWLASAANRVTPEERHGVYARSSHSAGSAVWSYGSSTTYPVFSSAGEWMCDMARTSDPSSQPT